MRRIDYLEGMARGLGNCLGICGLLLAATMGAGQPEADSDASRSRRKSAFSGEDYRALYNKAGEMTSSYSPAGVPELEGNPIELEPFVVKGDDTPLLAAVRRHLELGPVSIRTRVAELAPAMNRQVQFSGRANEAFFAAPAGGQPADTSRTVPITFEDILAINRSLTHMVRTVLPER